MVSADLASRLTGRFFFASRRRHTRFDCDWSSDVCELPRSSQVAGHIAGGGAPGSLGVRSRDSGTRPRSVGAGGPAAGPAGIPGGGAAREGGAVTLGAFRVGGPGAGERADIVHSPLRG